MKTFRILFSIFTAFLAVMTMTTVSLGATFDHIQAGLLDGGAIIAMAASPIIALDAYSGDYEKFLFSTLQNNMDVAQDIEFLSGVRNTRNMTKLVIQPGARPYAGGLEDLKNEAIKFTGTKLVVETGQRDFSIEIEKYKEYHMEMERPTSEGSSANSSTIPWAAQTMDEIFKSLASEINDNTAYFGFDKDEIDAYDASEAYTVGARMIFQINSIDHYYECVEATTAGQTPLTHASKWIDVNAKAIAPGLDYRLQELIADGKVVPNTLGAITDEDAYGQFTEMARTHDRAYQKAGFFQFCSFESFHKLTDNIESSVAKYTEKDSSWWNGRGLVLPKTDAKIIVLPVTWMGNSNRIISSPKENLIGATDLMSDLNTISNRKATNYLIVSSIKFRIGFTIRDPKALRCSELA